MQLQQKVHALQTIQFSSEEYTSPLNSATENREEALAERPNSGTKSLGREEERLRRDLFQEKQKAAEVQLDNERLLAVILKLKCEMDIEHELYEEFQKKSAAEQSGGRWQKLKQVMRSSSILRESRDSKKRSTFQRGWSFRESRSRKQ